MDGLTMPDFIDRAKLEALAEERYPESDLKVFFVEQFMAGAAAYAALLDAETTEEWGTESQGGYISPAASQLQAEVVAETLRKRAVSRRVLYGPWLPSEGGEKP